MAASTTAAFVSSDDAGVAIGADRTPYRVLAGLADRVRVGLEPWAGRTVAVRFDPGPEAPALLLGALRADVDVIAVFAGRPVPEQAAVVVGADGQPEAGPAGRRTAAEQRPSGSRLILPADEGEPGGIGLRGDGVLAAIMSLAGALDLRPDDIACAAPSASARDLLVSLAAWHAGADVTIPATDAATTTPDGLRWAYACAAAKATVSAAGQPRLLSAAEAMHPLRENVDLGPLRVVLTDAGARPLSPNALRRFNDVVMEFGFDETAICPVYTLGGLVPVTVVSPDSLWRCRVVDPEALRAGRWQETLTDGGAEVISYGRPLPGVDVHIAADGPVGPIEVTLGTAWYGTGGVGALVREELHPLAVGVERSG